MTDSKELTPQQSFEEKVKDRLRENIGDLMPDEILQDMVKKAMQEMFFTRRDKKGDGWGARTEVFPSWFEDEVSTRLKERVLEEAKMAIEAKRPELQEIISKLISEKMPEIILNGIIGVISQVSVNSNYTIRDEIIGMMRSRGMTI